MRKTLICSHDPILIKNLYGLLIDGGYMVEVVDHVAFAIKRVMEGDIELLVADATTFGLSVMEAIEIIKNVVPELPYIIVGSMNSKGNTHEIPQNGLMHSILANDLERLRTFLKVMREPEISIFKGG